MVQSLKGVLSCIAILTFAACGGSDGGGLGQLGEACRENGLCGPRLYCRYDEGQCTGTGTCERIPEVCTQEVMPVCACNGMEYANRCFAEMDGQSLEFAEACPAPPLVQ